MPALALGSADIERLVVRPPQDIPCSRWPGVGQDGELANRHRVYTDNPSSHEDAM